MNNNEINKKLRDISKKLEDRSPKSMARFDPDSFSQQEKQLFAKVNEFIAKDGSEKLTDKEIAENLALVSKAEDIIMRKAVELFTSIMPSTCGGSKLEIWFFNQFFYNFLLDYIEGLETIQKYSEKQLSDFLSYLKENNKLDAVYKISPWEPKDFVGLAISWGWDDIKKRTKKHKKTGRRNTI